MPEPVPVPVPLLPGKVEVPPGDVEVLPGSGEVLLPIPGDVAPLVAPPPLVMRSSRRHLSRSAPIRPRHLLLVAPEVLGVVAVPGRPEGPVVPDAPGVADMPGVEPLGVEPVPPDVDEPGAPLVPCASDMPDSAKNAAAVAAQMSFDFIGSRCPYLLVPEEPLEPEPLAPGVLLAPLLLPLPDDMPLEELPLLLGLLLLGLLLLGLLLPDVPPVDAPLEPKCLSHSARDTCPSLLVSTDEKLGALELLEDEPPDEPVAPLDALPALDPPELEPVALGDDEEEPDELGEDEDELGEDDAPELLLPLAELSLEPPEELLPEALGVELLPLAPPDEEPELCASETLASAKSAAAVAVVTTFRTMWTSS